MWNENEIINIWHEYFEELSPSNAKEECDIDLDDVKFFLNRSKMCKAFK